MPHRTADGTWRVRYKDRGRRLSRNFRTKVMAEQFEAKHRLGIEMPERAPKCKVTFREFADRWLTEYCYSEKSETQHKNDKSVIESYLNHAFGSVRLSDLGRKDLHDLKVEISTKNVGRNKRPMKPKSVNNVLMLAKAIMQKAVEWEVVPHNPFTGVKALKVHGQAFDYWTIEERERFIRFARQIDPDFTKAVEVAAVTGLRLGELAGLTCGDLNFERRTITVGRSYSHKLKKGLGRTKTGRVEEIPMNDRALAALKEHRLRKPADPVFPEALLRQAVRKLRALCEATGTRPIRFHDLRHTFASCALMEGADLYSVQKLMRHASVKMTERYGHLSPGHLLAASQRVCGAVPDQSPIEIAARDGQNLSAGNDA